MVVIMDKIVKKEEMPNIQLLNEFQEELVNVIESIDKLESKVVINKRV